MAGSMFLRESQKSILTSADGLLQGHIWIMNFISLLTKMIFHYKDLTKHWRVLPLKHEWIREKKDENDGLLSKDS